MYKQIETAGEIIMANAVITKPIATLQDECGAICHIINDDHCYVLCIEKKDGSCHPTTHIFKEAFKVLRQLPPPF